MTIRTEARKHYIIEYDFCPHLEYLVVVQRIIPKKQVFALTNNGIVPIYVIYSVKTRFKKKDMLSHKVKSFQLTGSFATGFLVFIYR